MKLFILSIPFLFVFNILNAQIDSLSQYSLNQLDSIYQQLNKAGKRNQLFPYSLAMLNKANKELDKSDTAYAKILFKVGRSYYFVSNGDSALVYYQKAVDIQKNKIPKHVDYASSLNNLALLHNDMGNYALAEPLYEEALKIRKEVLGDKHVNYAMTLSNLAMLYPKMGNHALAEPLYHEALKIYKEVLGDQNPYYANSLNNLANLYSDMGNYVLAEPLYEEALKIRKEVLGDKHPEYAASLDNLATLYYAIGNYALAESLLQKALKIYKEVLGDKHLYYAKSLNNLAILYYDIKNYALAEPLYEEALKIYKEVLGDKHPDYVGNLINLGILYRAIGDYAKAASFCLEAKQVFESQNLIQHPFYMNCLNTLASLYKSMGNYALAESTSQEVLKIRKEALGNKHPDYAKNLSDLASLYDDMGAYSQAEIYYSQCFTVKNFNLSANFSWLPEKGKAAYWQKEKDFYQDLNNYAVLAVATFPQAAVLAYNSNLVAKGLLLESTKEVEEAAMASKDSLTIQIFETLREKRRFINHLVSSGMDKKEMLDQYEIEADSLDKILVGRLGEYAASKRKFQITWKEVQNALADNDIAIEFARYYNYQDSQYYYQALLLRKDYELPKLIKLASEKAISAIPAGKGFADLYKLIWEPIDSFLQDVNTVYYSPDGVLNNISFAALCSKGTEQVISTKDVKRGGISKTSSKTSECNYLSDKYTLHQLSTSRYLAEGLKTSQIDNSMLVFGGVNYDEIPSTGDTLAEVQFMEMEDYVLAENISRSSNNQSRMEYLPGTQTELQNVQKIMNKKQWKVRAFSDKNASENILKSEIEKEAPSILHIATHGFAFPDIQEKKNDNKSYRDSDNPMARCGLLFAGANHSWTGNSKSVLSQSGEDGILTALEVSNLPLKNTKLVVLSACETGLGKIQGTEGVFGLKRGFKLALVEQIIVSLWSVPDKETMELMDIFYNDLAKTRNAVISFEKAQKEMRKKYADRPDLWAGFVLVR